MGVMKRLNSARSSYALTGFKELGSALRYMKGASKRATRAGVNAGLAELNRGIRSTTNASSASKEVKRAARGTLGKTVRKAGGEYIGKAGFGVGRQSKARKEKATARASSKDRGGVGVSASNIHWFILGTDEREHKKTQKRTGKIEPVLKGIVSRAVATSSPAMLRAAKKKLKQVLAREAKKAKKK